MTFAVQIALERPGRDEPAPEPLRWYALTVRHQHEARTQAALGSKGLETLVPTYRARRQWSDRIKEVQLPLFSGYVFCRFVHGDRVGVLDTPGVGKIVGFGGNHMPVDEQEIAAIQAVMASGLPARPWPHLKPGDRVRVERGPLRGIEGTLLREKDAVRLVIGLELLSRSVAVDMEPDMIAPSRLFHAVSG